MYSPRKFGGDPKDGAALLRYVEDELRRLAASQADVLEVHLRPIYKEPEKYHEGMIVYADGSDWNPGAGKGVYVRGVSAWSKL